MPPMLEVTSKIKSFVSHNFDPRYPFLSSEIFNCELNTVLEKFFEAPEPPQPEKDEKEGAEKSGDEGEEG